MTQEATGNGRLLIVADLERLGPVIAGAFAPHKIDGVHTYLDAIAEIPRATTRAVLVSHDKNCARLESAIGAMKQVAGDARVIFCCEPAYENVGRTMLAHGADDYLITPLDTTDLERAVGLPSRQTQHRWIATPSVAPVPSAEELARLADILSRMGAEDAGLLDALATLVCSALGAESASVLIDGRSGHAGRWGQGEMHAALVEPICQGEQRSGQIRVGRKNKGAYTHEDSVKLRHYGVLIGRLLESAVRAASWRTMALTDDLTGLPNRRRLMEFLESKLALAAKSRQTVTALVFDIDDFKRYNDLYGHDAGDEILRESGRLFLECSRKTDMVARYGGDEFVVVFWDPEGPRIVGSQHPQGVIGVVQRFRAALQKHQFSRLGPEAIGCLTISGGLAHYPWQAQTAQELIDAADHALLKAKQAGKNRFWVVGEGDART